MADQRRFARPEKQHHMTIGTTFGFYYRGAYFTRHIAHHSEWECCLGNYFLELARDLLTRMPREEIEARLDAARTAALGGGGGDGDNNTVAAAAAAPFVYYPYGPRDKNTRILGWDSYIPTTDSAVDRSLHYVPATTAAATGPSSDLVERIRAEVRERMLSRSEHTREWWSTRKLPEIPVLRFDEVFHSGDVCFFDEALITKDGGNSRESFWFELSWMTGRMYTPCMTYIIDLDKNHLFYLNNLRESDSYCDWFPEYICDAETPESAASESRRRMPTLLREPEYYVSGSYLQKGAFYRLYPLV